VRTYHCSAERNLETPSYHKSYLKYKSREHDDDDDWNEDTALKELVYQEYPDDDDDPENWYDYHPKKLYERDDLENWDDMDKSDKGKSRKDRKENMDTSDKGKDRKENPWSEYPTWDPVRGQIHKQKHETEDEKKMKEASRKRRTAWDSVDEILTTERII
jgi:hypothetical protein